MIEARDILRWYGRYGWTDTCGSEWGLVQRRERQQFHDVLDSGDAERLEALLSQFLRTPLYFGLVSMPPAETNEELMRDLAIQTAWRVALWHEHVRPFDLRRIAAPSVGDPVTVTIDGTPIITDAPRFDYYASVIADYLSPLDTLLEIGGGYGGVALQLLRRNPFARIVLVDIPETLYLAAWFLSRATEQSVGWWDEDKRAKVLLVPTQDIEHADIPRPRMVFAAHTFSGLPLGDIAAWMRYVDGSGAQWLYHDDVLHQPIAEGTWLTDTFPEVTIDEMPRPTRYREKWRNRIAWTMWGDRFTEVFWERI